MAKRPAPAMTGRPVWTAAPPVELGAPATAELARDAREAVSELRAPLAEELIAR